MPKIHFECDLCVFKTKKYVGGWRKHLIEENHQIRTRIRSKSFKEAEKQRCCVVFGIRGLKRKDVLKFFSDKHVVTDFIFWKECPDICIVEFLTKTFCDSVMAETKSILGNEVVFRLRNEISDIEWRAICPLSALKVEDDAPESSTPDDNKESDDDCIVIENPQVEVKKEVVDVDLETQDKIPASTTPSNTPSTNEKNNNNHHSPGDIKPNIVSIGLELPNNQSSTPVSTESHVNVNSNRPPVSLNVKKECEKSPYIEMEKDSFSEEVPSKRPRTTCGSPIQPNISQNQYQGTTNTNNNNIVTPNRLERSNMTDMRQDVRNIQVPQPQPCNASNEKTLKARRAKMMNYYHLILTPTPAFSNQITLVKDQKLKNDLLSSIHVSWAAVVQEFNLLVWENFFGIELYELPPENDDTHGLRDGYVQDGPLIRGILISDDKIEKLAQLSSSNADAKIVKSQKRAILEHLKRGIQPRPLKYFDEAAQNLSKRSQARLTFKLQMSHQNRSTQDVKAKPICMLTFLNIITTDNQQFKRLVLLYQDLWKDYSLHRIQVKLGSHH